MLRPTANSLTELPTGFLVLIRSLLWGLRIANVNADELRKSRSRKTAVDEESQRSDTKRQAYEWIRDLERTHSGQCYERSVREKFTSDLMIGANNAVSNAGILDNLLHCRSDVTERKIALNFSTNNLKSAGTLQSIEHT
jgi:hypothetical protein